MLMAADVAAEYRRTESWKRFESAPDLVNDISSWMVSKGLAKSTIDRLDVAEHVLRLQAEARQPVATPEQVAWQNDMQQGIGDPAAELALAGRLQAMSQAEYSEFRKTAGLQQSVAAFLSGQ